MRLAVAIILAGGIFVSCDRTQGTTEGDSSAGTMVSIDSADMNNDFYDNSETYPLAGGVIEIAGETENPGTIDLAPLPKRSVIVKEALPAENGSNRFVGAYRYDGYSLFDILKDRIPDKKNKEEFRHVIDLYVEIENGRGEKVVLSWGEIFYPTDLHRILLATGVSRIIPSKTRDLWPLPDNRKLVVGNDLLSVRNISDPVRITIRSCPMSFPVDRDLDPLYSPGFLIRQNGKETAEITALPSGLRPETVPTVFYGRGRGIHSTTSFSGVPLKEILGKSIIPDPESLRQGLAVVVGADGYRAVFSLAEIFNRGDCADVLLVPCEDGTRDGGKFRVFPAGDFFSDRSVKAVSRIIIE
jgi:hypothetical protein